MSTTSLPNPNELAREIRFMNNARLVSILTGATLIQSAAPEDYDSTLRDVAQRLIEMTSTELHERRHRVQIDY